MVKKLLVSWSWLVVAVLAGVACADDPVVGQAERPLTGDRYYDSIVAVAPGGDLGFLDALARPIQRYPNLAMARVFLRDDEAAVLRSRPDVLTVRRNRLGRLLNAEGREMMRVNAVQSRGHVGGGVEVAVLDTGIDATHPDLVDRVMSNWVVVGDEGYDALFALNYDQQLGVLVTTTPDEIDVRVRVLDAAVAQALPAGTAVNTDDHGHGTHVAGTIAGTGAASDGHLRGMAPGAKIHSYDVHFTALTMWPFEAFDHILGENRAGRANIRVVNNSWGPLEPGCSFDPFDPGHLATRRLYEAGVLVEFSYGNNGEVASCNILSTAPWVLGTGATDKAYRLAGFSSRGRIDDNHDREVALANVAEFLAAPPEEQAAWDPATRPIGLFRPGVVAPGVNIVSAQHPYHAMTFTGTPYGAASGTSMSGPMASGVAALVVGAYRDAHGRLLTPIEVIRLLEVTANRSRMVGYDTHEAGAGFVDADAAVAQALAGDLPPRVTEEHLVVLRPDPDTTVTTTPISGTVLVNSWQTNEGYEVHDIVVPPRAVRVRAQVTWASELEKVYLRLYAPGKDPSGSNSAATGGSLTAITKTRTVDVLSPEPGLWKLRVDGRVNAAATSYSGTTQVHATSNVAPTAAVTVTPERVGDDNTVAVTATVFDADGASTITDATLVVRDRKGRTRARYDRAAFTAIDETTLRLVVDPLVLDGPAPWIAEVTARDERGRETNAQALVGRK